MKKTIATILVLAPLATAHAQNTVTVYGILDASATVGSGGGGAPNTKRIESGVGPGSRLGFRGTEEMGDGLRALFNIEMGFASDTGALQQGGLAWGRQAYVGLASPQGWRITMGRQYGPTEVAMVVADAMAQVYWGSTSGTGLGALQSPASTAGAGCHGYTTRINNSIIGSWTGAGFTTRMMVGAGDENARGTGRLLNPSITYSSGPLMLTAAYTRFRQCAADIAPAATPAWQTETVVGGTFELGRAKLFAGYYDFDPSENNKTITPTTALDTKAYWIGARVPVVAPGTLIAQVTRERQKFSARTGNATVLGVTYEHALSKRTLVYVSAGKIWNDDNAARGLAAATATQGATALGADPRVVSLGITHSF